MANREEETYSLMFASLKHPIRRKILRILAAHPSTFTEILEQVDVESAHLSYHLESLGGLIKKIDDTKYSLSDPGRAAVSLMTRVEEPSVLVSPAILRTPGRLKVVRVSCMLLILIGLALLVNGVAALPTVDFRKTVLQTSADTDLYAFSPRTVSGFSGYYYFGDGVYGVQIDLGLRDSYSTFPVTVRLITPQTGTNGSDYWNQSWYEWYGENPPTSPGSHERLAVTILVTDGSPQIVSQESFDHVHPSPGRVIGTFRPTDALVLFQTMAGTGNVTLTGFQAFRIQWFYFPNGETVAKNLSTMLGIALLLPSVAFILASRDLQKSEKRRWIILAQDIAR